MAWFTAKEWKNRLVEFAGRRSLKNVSTNETTVYDVTRNEGQVSQEGDSFSATTMNDLEQRISDAFAEAEEANTQLTSEIEALNDEGAIKGLEVREGDGVYITYQDGADTVSKKLGSKNFQLGVSCYSGSDTSGSFSQYSYSGIDVSDYSKLKIITGTGLNVTVDNIPAQKEGDYYLLNGNSLSFVIQTRPLGAKVEFELLV